MNTTIDNLIDALGEAKAAKAEAAAEEKRLVDTLKGLIAEGTAEEGDLFRAAHVVAVRETVNWKAVAAKLKPSTQLVTAHTRKATVHSIRVTARNGDDS